MKSIVSLVGKAAGVVIGKRLCLLLLLLPSTGLLKANPINHTNFKVIIHNNLCFARNNEVIQIKRSAFGYIADDVVPVVKFKKQTLIYQLVDSNNDGVWDELLLQVSIRRQSTDTLLVRWVKGNVNKLKFPVSANVRFSLKSKTNQPTAEITSETRTRGFKQNIANPYYQMEGPGIENDKIAFRAFFDYRNGKDIYGKIVDTPVLKQVGVTSTWHVLQNWGMDIWKVGNSMGAGALGVKEQGKLYRLADADTSKFKNLYTGALQAAFKLSFVNWDVGSLRKNGSETVSITKGEYFYKDEISVPLISTQNLVSGLGNFGPYTVKYTRHNAKFSSISTYGKQAEGTGTSLGVAILFATNYYVGYQTTSATDSIPNTSYVQLHVPNNTPKVIRFFACWEKTDKRFSTQKGFEMYLQRTADRLANPITIKIINN